MGPGSALPQYSSTPPRPPDPSNFGLYGGDYSRSDCYRLQGTHQFHREFTQFSSQPSYPPPPPSQTIINGYVFPHQFPCVPQTHSQFFPPPYWQPIHPIAPQPLITTPQSPSIPTYHSPHPTPNIWIHPSIPNFQSPATPTFVPQTHNNEDTTNPSSPPPISDVSVQKEVLRPEVALSSLIDKLEMLCVLPSFIGTEEVGLASLGRNLDEECRRDDAIIPKGTANGVNLASTPELYPELVSLNTVPSNLNLLSHDSTDIAINAVSAQRNNNLPSFCWVSDTSTRVCNQFNLLNDDCSGMGFVFRANGIDEKLENGESVEKRAEVNSRVGREFDELESGSAKQDEGGSIEDKEQLSNGMLEYHALQLFDKMPQMSIARVETATATGLNSCKSQLSTMEVTACIVKKNESFGSKIGRKGALRIRLKHYIEGVNKIFHNVLQLCLPGFDKKVRDKGSGHTISTDEFFIQNKKFAENMWLLWVNISNVISSFGNLETVASGNGLNYTFSLIIALIESLICAYVEKNVRWFTKMSVTSINGGCMNLHHDQELVSSGIEFNIFLMNRSDECIVVFFSNLLQRMNNLQLYVDVVHKGINHVIHTSPSFKAIVDLSICANIEFGIVTTLNSWLIGHLLCLLLENKLETMSLFFADKCEKREGNTGMTFDDIWGRWKSIVITAIKYCTEDDSMFNDNQGTPELPDGLVYFRTTLVELLVDNSQLLRSTTFVQKCFSGGWASANAPISWKDVEIKLFALNVVAEVILQESQILDFSVIMQLVMILSTRPLDELKGIMCINVHSSLGDVDDSYSKCISVFQTIARPLLLFLAATLLLNNVERDENLIAALASSLGKDCSGCIKIGELDQSCKKIYLCHEQFKALVRSNLYICKWFGLSVICVQGLTLLLAIILKALGLCHYYDSDDDYILERVSLLKYSPHGVFSITTDGSKNDACNVLMIIFGDYLWTMYDQPKDNILIGDIELPGVLAIFVSAVVLGGTNDQLFWYYKSKIMKYLKELAKVFDIKSQMETLVDYQVRPPQKKICSSFMVDFILLPFTSSFCSLHLQLDAKRVKTSQHSPTLYRIAEIRVKNLKVLAIEKYLRDAIESWLDGILGENGSCEIKWGGNFTKQGSLDYGADFGFGLYIDHHYYLGYFLYGISVLAKIELEWGMRYKPQVDSLAADSMNLDKRTGFHYSLVRCFDLYKLHSWVGGVTYKGTMQDGYDISKFRFEIVAFCLSSRLFLKLEVKFQLKRGGVVRTQFYDLQVQVCIEAHNSSFGCESP